MCDHEACSRGRADDTYGHDRETTLQYRLCRLFDPANVAGLMISGNWQRRWTGKQGGSRSLRLYDRSGQSLAKPGSDDIDLGDLWDQMRYIKERLGRKVSMEGHFIMGLRFCARSDK